MEHQELGRWTGVACRVGSDMSYWIIPIYDQPMVETTVQHVTRDDILDPNIAVQINHLIRH